MYWVRDVVWYLWDPFAEADAQVAFLVQRGHASAVITEDSDILVYMAAIKCTAPVLYKLDEFGKCKELGFDPAKLSGLPGTKRTRIL